MQKKSILFLGLLLLTTQFSLVFGNFRDLQEYRWIRGPLSPKIIDNIFITNPNLETFILSRDYAGFYDRYQTFESPESNKYDDAGECIESLAKHLCGNKNLKKLTIKIHQIEDDKIWLKLFESLKSSNIKDLTLSIKKFYSHENHRKVWCDFFEILPELKLEILDFHDADIDFLLRNEFTYSNMRENFIEYLKSDNCSIKNIYFPEFQNFQTYSFLNSFLRQGYKNEISIEELKPSVFVEHRYDKTEKFHMEINYKKISRIINDIALPLD